MPRLTLLLIALNVLMYLLVAVASGSLTNPKLDKLVAFGANYGPLTLTGQWWRMETSTFLHGGLLHLLFNMWALLNLGLLAEIIFGASSFFALYILAGLAGSVASLWWHPTVVGVGASGAIFGLAGALLPALFFEKNSAFRAAMRGNLASIGLFVVYNIAYGATDRRIDNAAHLGGLVAGLALGASLPRITHRVSSVKSRRAIAISTLTALIITAAAATAVRSSGILSYSNARKAAAAGDVPKAIELAQRAVAQDPELTEAHELLANLYLSNKDPQRAIPEIEAVIKQAPDYPFGYAQYCVALLRAKRVDDAVSACRKAAQLDPQNADTQFNLGLAARANGDSSSALSAFAAAARLRPDSPEENYWYGIALLENGTYDKAIQQFEKVLTIDPDNEGALQALAEARRRLEK